MGGIRCPRRVAEVGGRRAALGLHNHVPTTRCSNATRNAPKQLRTTAGSDGPETMSLWGEARNDDACEVRCHCTPPSVCFTRAVRNPLCAHKWLRYLGKGACTQFRGIVPSTRMLSKAWMSRLHWAVSHHEAPRLGCWQRHMAHNSCDELFFPWSSSGRDHVR